MNLVVIAIALAISANVEVTLAPDEPLPYVYVDDPLLIELRSPVDGNAQVTVSTQASHQAVSSPAPLIQVPLHAKGTQWCEVQGVPVERGYYTVKAQVSLPGADTDWTGHYCRIDRQAEVGRLPLRLYGIGNGGPVIHALRAIGLTDSVFPLAQNGAPERLEEAAKAGFSVSARIDAALMTDAVRQMTDWAWRFSGNVCRWDLDTQGNAQQLIALVNALRSAGSNAPVTAVATDTAMLRQYLEQGAGPFLKGVVLENPKADASEVQAMRALAQRAGFEDWPVYVSLRGDSENAQLSGPAVIQRVFDNLAAGAVETALPSSFVFQDELREPAVYVSGLSHRFLAGRFAGRPALGNGLETWLFCRGARWLLAVRSVKDKHTAVVDTGDAKNLVLTDALNNPLPLPEAVADGIHLEVDDRFILLSGVGGSLLGRTAMAQSRQMAREFQANPVFAQGLPGGVRDIVDTLVQQAGGASSRPNYLALLQSFPTLEKDWHTGTLPQHVAASAIEQLAGLARELCTVEQQGGLPFLEPLPDMLARAEENQSLYLTSSAGAGKTCERGDLILEKVRQLMDEAQQLADADRRIEAAAVAALAEWRSRALEFAATAKETPKFVDPLTVTPGPAPPLLPPGTEPGAERKSHRAEKNDTSASLADKYQIKLKDFLDWNGLSRRERLKTGKTYFVEPEQAAQPESPEPPSATPPAPEKPAEEAKAEPEPQNDSVAPEKQEAPPAVPDAQSGRKKHKVARGDNPSVIANKYGISTADFLKWNKLGTRARMQIGDEYFVSPPDSAEQAAASAAETVSEKKSETSGGEKPQADEKPAGGDPAPDTPSKRAQKHSVKKGDVPAAIAKNYSISVEDFFRWNRLTPKSQLQIGDEYWVVAPKGESESKPTAKGAREAGPPPEPAANSEAKDPDQPAGTKKVTHTASGNDTAQSVSQKYGVSLRDFYRWNHFRRGDSVQSGKKYRIFVKQ